MLQALAHYSIHQLAHVKPDARTWRPSVLVLSGAPTKRWHLIELAQSLTQGQSFLTLATIMSKSQGGERLGSTESSIQDYLAKKGVQALVEVQSANDVVEGAESMIHSYGIGSIRPNTLIFGETNDPQQMVLQARLIQTALIHEKNVLVMRKPPSREILEEQPFKISEKQRKS